MNAADGSPRRRKRRLLTGYDESGVSVKQEPDDDIKDYAETTMNELLGWYGYEKVDSRDTQGLNLQHFAASATSPASTPEGSGSEDPTQGVSRPPSGRAGSVSPSQEGSSLASDAVARQHQQMVSALSAIPKHPGAPESPNLPPGCIVCAWCQKVGMKLFTLKTPNGCKAFCSELCFTQCRRASFKKNKVCDWCKHVRHTVNYVDFQDGEQQLQFCSDKCLNQYKMNIFCKETQAHLQMHTHLKEAACKMAASGSVNLITPELWLRDCKTHSNGHSHSSNEAIEVREDVNSHENVSVITSAQMSSSEPLNVSLREEKETRHHFNRVPREKDKLRRPGRSSSKHSSGKNGDDIQSHHHIRHRDRTIGGSGSVNTSSNPNPSTPQTSPTTGSRSTLMNGPSPNLSSPPIGASPRPQPPHHQHHQQQTHHGPPLPSPIGLGMDHMRPPFLPPGLIPPPFHLFAQQQMEAFLRAQHGIGMRPGAPPVPFPPWVVPPFPHMVPPPPPHRPPPPPPSGSSGSSSHPGQHSQPSPKSQPPPPPQAHPVPPPPHHHHPTAPQPSSSLLPPVTVMVPFPVVLPLPVPIPIPIPIPSHIIEKFKKQKQEQQKKEQQKSNQQQQQQQQQQRYQQQQAGHEKKNSPSENRESNFNNETLLDTSDSDGSISNATNSKDLNSKRVESVINRLVNVRSGSWIANRRSLPFQDSDTVTQNDIPPRNTNHSKSQRKDSELTMDGRITDLDSRSYSPLSEIISTDDDNTGDDILDSDVEQGSRLSFSSYAHSAMSSSLSTSVTNTTEYSKPWGLANNRMTILRSPSPPHRFLGEKRNATDQSSTQINSKRKCIRDKVNSVS